MRITIHLDSDSIENAIRKLESMKYNLEQTVGDFVDILLTDGEAIANQSYGGMATAWGRRDSAEDGIVTGHIGVSAEDPDAAIIAEFGAGYATMEYHPWADRAPVPIEVGSYSRENDNGQDGGMFWRTHSKNPGEGFWKFGGVEYDRVEPRHGLLDAYDHIVQNADEIAKEVIQLD